MSAVTASVAPLPPAAPPFAHSAAEATALPPVTNFMPEAIPAPPKISVEAYLEWERDSDLRELYRKTALTAPPEPSPAE